MTGIVLVAAARAAEPDVIVDLAGVLLDDRRDVDERVVAAASLAATADPAVLPFLRAAARDRSPEVQRAALDAAVAFDDPEAVAIAGWLALDAATHLDVRLAAVEALGAFGREDAARALWEIAGAKGVNDHVRSSASRRVALGALVGSTVGFGGGAAVGALVDAPALRLGRAPRLPGRWSGSVLPFSGDEERLGVMVNVRASGW